MGLRPFSKHSKSKSSKSGSSEKPPPPVFSKHGIDDLKKGHKSHSSSTKPHIQPHSSSNSSHATSSTALWVAASNADAYKRNHNKQKPSSVRSEESFLDDPVDDTEYYEEEIIEEEILEEEILDDGIDGLPPRRITIRFDEYDEMQTILHINDYTNHEINKAWFKREDYDKMVTLARKTAQKAEERIKEIENGKLDSKKGRKIESRGLEAWTPLGATKSKMIKDSAVEAVWNEQSRQWDAGVFEPDKIRSVYIKISKGSQKIANDRALSDALIAKQIRQLDKAEEEKKRKRKLLGKTKALVRKTGKVTTGGVVKTTKLVGKTTKMTGKVALGTAKVAKKTAVATATLDRKMLKEAIIPARNKRECERQIVRRPSQSSMATADTAEGKFIILDRKVGQPTVSLLIRMTNTFSLETGNEAEEVENETEAKKKAKLKLLGLVPIPGTHKTYREDRRQKESEKRQNKQARRPSWEAGLTAGKY